MFSVLTFVLDKARAQLQKALGKGKLMRMTTIALRESKLGRGFSSESSTKVIQKKTKKRVPLIPVAPCLSELLKANMY